MNTMRALNKAFREKDLSNSGSIDKGELPLVLQAAGLKLSKSEILDMFNELDLSEDGEISQQEFDKFFNKKISTQSNADRFNRLLVRPVIGKSKQSTYNLPGPYTTHGQKLKRDPEGAGAVILSHQGFVPSQQIESSINIVKMNKNAAGKKCRTAKEFTQYNKTHKVYDEKCMLGSKSRLQMLKDQRKMPESVHDMTFGAKVRRGEAPPSISDLINGKFNEGMGNGAVERCYPQNTASNIRRSRPKPSVNNCKSTNASRLRMKSVETQKQQMKSKNYFKMKRFENVESKFKHSTKYAYKSALASAGNQVMSG